MIKMPLWKHPLKLKYFENTFIAFKNYLLIFVQVIFFIEKPMCFLNNGRQFWSWKRDFESSQKLEHGQEIFWGL
jgi:CRISPR/Cas system CMR-associated protein Cmr1 (group 7 of RAMP superfamily)